MQGSRDLGLPEMLTAGRQLAVAQKHRITIQQMTHKNVTMQATRNGRIHINMRAPRQALHHRPTAELTDKLDTVVIDNRVRARIDQSDLKLIRAQAAIYPQ